MVWSNAEPAEFLKQRFLEYTGSLRKEAWLGWMNEFNPKPARRKTMAGSLCLPVSLLTREALLRRADGTTVVLFALLPLRDERGNV